MPYLYKLTLVFSIVISLFTAGKSQHIENENPKVSKLLLTKLDGQHEVPVIIYLKDQQRFSAQLSGTKKQKARFVFNSLKERAEQSQAAIIDYLTTADVAYRSFYIVNALAFKGNLNLVRYLADLPEIAGISLDSPIENPRFFTELIVSNRDNDVPEWGLQVIKADSVWDLGFKGQNVVVGGQDTGYDWTHPAIKSKYRGYIDENEVDHNYNWHDAIHEIDPLHNDSIVDPSNNPCGLDVAYPCDDSGHGTHTMGTMVGLDGPNIIGVAPDAQWIGSRNMERGWGKPSTYIESFEWFLAPTDLNDENPNPDMAPHVINNSWSCPAIEGCDPSNWSFMDIAIENLKASGVVVVVSAGNSGNNCGRIAAPPSMFESSFAVGATKITDTIEGRFIDAIAGYSSWGPVTVDSSNRLKPDISAPGSRVRSSTPGNHYGVSSGTSMAGPHVAGVVALIISANPNLAGKVETIEDIIQLSAVPMTKNDSCGIYSGNDIPNYIYGYGRINALEAVKMALLTTGTEYIKKAAAQVTIYPNPASELIRISWAGNQQSAKLKIVDIRGKTHLFTHLANGGTLNISMFPKGIYILKINIERQLITKKFIKL